MNLRSKGQESKYYPDLDYEAMLYLDKNCMRDLMLVNKDFLRENSIDTINMISSGVNQHTKYFNSSLIEIKDLFTKSSDLESIFRDLLGIDYNLEHNLDPTIYIKDSGKAIYSIYGNNWSKTYRATLTKGQLKIELLYEIIE
jgi:hypothetical protein